MIHEAIQNLISAAGREYAVVVIFQEVAAEVISAASNLNGEDHIVNMAQNLVDSAKANKRPELESGFDDPSNN